MLTHIARLHNGARASVVEKDEHASLKAQRRAFNGGGSSLQHGIAGSLQMTTQL